MSISGQWVNNCNSALSCEEEWALLLAAMPYTLYASYCVKETRTESSLRASSASIKWPVKTRMIGKGQEVIEKVDDG